MKSGGRNEILLGTNDIMKLRKYTHCLSFFSLSLFFCKLGQLTETSMRAMYNTRMLKGHLISNLRQKIFFLVFVQNNLLIYLIQQSSSLLSLPFGFLGSVLRPEHLVPSLLAS